MLGPLNLHIRAVDLANVCTDKSCQIVQSNLRKDLMAG